MATNLSKDKKRESNSLSRYFKDLNESDLDSDESDDSPTEPTKSSHTPNDADEKEQFGELSKSPSNTPVKIQKLPSARECLNTKSSPSFLKINQKKEINWDCSHKKLEGENDDDGIIDYKTNAVPPPSSYEPVTDPGIKVVDSDGKKRKSSAQVLEDQMMSSKKAYRVEKQEQSEKHEDET